MRLRFPSATNFFLFQQVEIATSLHSHRGKSGIMALSTLAAFGTKHVAKGISRLSQEVIESGSGSYVTMDSGRRMLDFTSGIGVTNLGHCHPKVTKAAQDQIGKLVHGQVIQTSNGTTSKVLINSGEHCFPEAHAGTCQSSRSSHATQVIGYLLLLEFRSRGCRSCRQTRSPRHQEAKYYCHAGLLPRPDLRNHGYDSLKNNLR